MTSWQDRLASVFGLIPDPAPPPPPAPSPIVPPSDRQVRAVPAVVASGGGRKTVDAPGGWSVAPFSLLPPHDADAAWSLYNLDNRALQRLSAARLVELLADLSPDVSKALFDFLRLTNAGWEFTCTPPGSDKDDPAAHAAVETFIGLLSGYYGSMDVIIGRMFINAFLRGGFLAELVVDGRGRQPIDFVVPDAATVRFKLVDDPARGRKWQLGQIQAGGKFVELDTPLIRYLPLDPFPGNPYGRPMVSPALFTSLFLLGMLHDLRRVVGQQGWTRLDLSVDMERLKTMAPVDPDADPDRWAAWVNATIEQVKDAYASLEPDAMFVHTDIVAVNRPVGAVDAQSVGGIDGIINNLESMSVRALKTSPLLMGMTEGLSEASSNRLWESHLAGIKAIQHGCETVIGQLFTLALQVQGIQATVTWRFAENRASEMFRDAQTRTMELANIRQEYEAGWISQDEAAEKAVGHPADEPEPRYDVGGNPTEGFTTVNPEPGENRVLPFRRTISPTPVVIPVTPSDLEAASDEWDATMPGPYQGLLDAEVEQA